MEALESRLEYYELLMTLNNLNDINEYKLPEGYSFSFWQDSKDLENWIQIHINSGEFTYKQKAKEIFDIFYSPFLKELNKRCFFIVENKTNKKIATATISPTQEHGYHCVVDWLAIDKKYWGNKLGKPLITKTLQLAKDLGYDKILLHTQTHTWLAAKMYLDFGFEPFNIEEFKGWQILKTITNHPKLEKFSTISENEMYFDDALNIVNELNKLHKNYSYEILHKNGKHEVWVRENNFVYKYLFYNNGKTLINEINALKD